MSVVLRLRKADEGLIKEMQSIIEVKQLSYSVHMLKGAYFDNVMHF